jgi:hypothetical protein
MDNRFYDNELERYLKEQTDQHRMYPSDQVWRNIQSEIHGYRKWPALTFISIFIIASLVVSTVLLKPHVKVASVNMNTNKNVNVEPPKSVAGLPVENEKNYADKLTVEKITKQTIDKVIQSVETNQPEEIFVVTESSHNAEIASSVNSSQNKQKITAEIFQEVQSLDNRNPSDKIASNSSISQTKNNIPAIFNPSLILRTNIGSADYYGDGIHSSYNFTFASSSEELNNTNDLRYNFNLGNRRSNSSSSLIKLGGSSSRFDVQFYLTPSISYRRLVDDANGKLAQSYITALPFTANYLIDVNRVIQHKPATGYEVGLSLGYNLSRKFALRPGIQFNVRQYNIDAYIHSAEPATIALSTNSSNDVFNTITGFRNVAGSTPIVLKNRYYEISLPLGIDWRPVNNKFAWGIAASIQPTYTFDKEPFIITSNFKNYADGSRLMRNWNINAGFETYFGYNTGKYRWQIGPQVRYQLLPTMNNTYPIREYLLDYGIKVGLVRSLSK